MQKKTIIMGIVICLLGIGYFLLNKPWLSDEDGELFNYLLNGYNPDLSITEIIVQEGEERLFNLFTLIDEKSNYGERFNDCTLVAFRDLELTISKDYLQAAINIYPNKRIEMYSNQEISNQLDQIDEQYYADHEIEYFDFIDKYTEGNIVKMDEIMFKIGAFSKLT